MYKGADIGEGNNGIHLPVDFGAALLKRGPHLVHRGTETARQQLQLGLARFLEGNHTAAGARLTEAYRQAVGAGAGGPVAAVALLLRGRARLEDGDRAGALDDFTVLAGLRSSDPWPLLYKPCASIGWPLVAMPAKTNLIRCCCAASSSS